MKDYGIKAIEVSKSFRLPHEKHTSLKQTVLNWHKRSFENLEVLKNISFEVKENEFFGILGRNGSGKSTLLKLIAGIYTPSGGGIDVNGRLTPFIELGVGFSPELTGRDNVFLNGAILGLTHEEIEAKYHKIVAFAELEKFMDQKLKNYSSGMQVRLAFSIAIQAHNEILLIDEVLAVGDAKFQQKCFDFFKTIKNKKTIIFVSHDMRSIRSFCDRAMILEKGKIMGIGDADEMAFQYGSLLLEEQLTIKRTKGQKGKHLGTGNATVSKVQIFSDPKDHSAPLLPNKPLRMKITYHVKKPVADAVFIVSVFDKDGRKILSSNTEEEGLKIASLKRAGSIEFNIPNSPLAPGAYKINVGIFGPRLVLAHDHYKDAEDFVVRGNNWGDYAVVTKTKWSMD